MANLPDFSDLSKKLDEAKKQIRQMINPELKTPDDEANPIAYRIARLKSLAKSISQSTDELSKEVGKLDTNLEVLFTLLNEQSVDKSGQGDNAQEVPPSSREEQTAEPTPSESDTATSVDEVEDKPSEDKSS